MNKKALIIGISGQDGPYLAKFLLKKKYSVTALFRKKSNSFINLKKIKVQKIKLYNLNYLDFNKIFIFLKKNKFDEIYFLSGQSSVFKSFLKPEETYKSNIFGILHILESCRILKLKTKIFNASSAEIFGNQNIDKLNENSEFNPVSPYGLSKMISLEITKIYRLMFDIKACSGIMFNHESPLRKKNFVIKKIITEIKKIKINRKYKLKIGNLNIYRDWGWAPEYVHAMWLMLNSKNVKDYVIGTGNKISLKKVVFYLFKKNKLSTKKNIRISKFFKRKHEIISNCADPRNIENELGWKSKINIWKILDNIELNKY